MARIGSSLAETPDLAGGEQREPALHKGIAHALCHAA